MEEMIMIPKKRYELMVASHDKAMEEIARLKRQLKKEKPIVTSITTSL